MTQNNSRQEGKSIEPTYPDFTEIVKACKSKMKLKFFEYGNSWEDVTITDEWWKKRLTNEIKEIFKAKDTWLVEKEIIDAINILAMMWEKYHLLTGLESGYRGR
jgi:hypothetical protein